MRLGYLGAPGKVHQVLSELQDGPAAVEAVAGNQPVDSCEKLVPVVINFWSPLACDSPKVTEQWIGGTRCQGDARRAHGAAPGPLERTEELGSRVESNRARLPGTSHLLIALRCQCVEC